VVIEEVQREIFALAYFITKYDSGFEVTKDFVARMRFRSENSALMIQKGLDLGSDKFFGTRVPRLTRDRTTDWRKHASGRRW
jgi:hypothetical protein